MMVQSRPCASPKGLELTKLTWPTTTSSSNQVRDSEVPPVPEAALVASALEWVAAAASTGSWQFAAMTRTCVPEAWATTGISLETATRAPVWSMSAATAPEPSTARFMRSCSFPSPRSAPTTPMISPASSRTGE